MNLLVILGGRWGAPTLAPSNLLAQEMLGCIPMLYDPVNKAAQTAYFCFAQKKRYEFIGDFRGEWGALPIAPSNLVAQEMLGCITGLFDPPNTVAQTVYLSFAQGKRY